jgi:large subunit ribosomal protein L25
MLKDLQIDPLERRILHADFYEVAMDEMVTVEVPIHLVGKSEGVKLGGILEQVRRTIEVQCLPGDIPKGIDVDVSALMIGDSIHVRDLQLEKVKIISDMGMTVATVVPPAAEEKKVVEEVEGKEEEKDKEKDKDKDKEKDKEKKKEEAK